jgi:hypothetical protein
VPQTKAITITDEETGEEREVEVQLVSIEQVEDFAWRPITIQGYFYGDAGIAGFSFGGAIIPYDLAVPVWQGYEGAILDYLNLDSDYYRIVGAKWTDSDFITDKDDNSVARPPSMRSSIPPAGWRATAPRPRASGSTQRAK